MTTLTEAREAWALAKIYLSPIPQSELIERIKVVESYLDEQVADSIEIQKLRSRLARAEAFMFECEQAFKRLQTGRLQEMSADLIREGLQAQKSFPVGERVNTFPSPSIETVRAFRKEPENGYKMEKQAFADPDDILMGFGSPLVTESPSFEWPPGEVTFPTPHYKFCRCVICQSSQK